MPKPDITQHIANQIKLKRKQFGWSLDQTAKATGVSKAMLGQIERQESSPTIATLWKIATGLSCSFSSFLSVEPGQKEVIEKPFKNDPDMRVKTLFPFNPETQIEMFEITLTHFHEQLSSAHQKGVTEYIYVISGTLSLLVGDSWERLEVGTQFLLNADKDHGYRDEEGLTRFITTIHYPKSGKALL